MAELILVGIAESELGETPDRVENAAIATVRALDDAECSTRSMDRGGRRRLHEHPPPGRQRDGRHDAALPVFVSE